MVVASAPLTIEEQIRRLPADALYEIVDDTVIEVPGMGVLAGGIANYLAFFINTYAIPKRLGTSFVEVIFQFRPELPQRRPDVSFVPASQLPANLTGGDDPPALHAVPTLAVEVISPNNTAAEIEDRRLEFFKAGVISVWVIHPIRRTVHVYDSATTCRVLTAADVLDGGRAIPGFQLKLSDLFGAIDQASSNNGANDSA